MEPFSGEMRERVIKTNDSGPISCNRAARRRGCRRRRSPPCPTRPRERRRCGAGGPRRRRCRRSSARWCRPSPWRAPPGARSGRRCRAACRRPSRGRRQDPVHAEAAQALVDAGELLGSEEAPQVELVEIIDHVDVPDGEDAVAGGRQGFQVRPLGDVVDDDRGVLGLNSPLRERIHSVVAASKLAAEAGVAQFAQVDECPLPARQAGVLEPGGGRLGARAQHDEPQVRAGLPMPGQLEPHHRPAAQGGAVHGIAQMASDKDQVLHVRELYIFVASAPRAAGAIMNAQSKTLVIAGGVRTAFGHFASALSDFQPVDLMAETVKASLSRSRLAPEAVDGLLLGWVGQSFSAPTSRASALSRPACPRPPRPSPSTTTASPPSRRSPPPAASS